MSFKQVVAFKKATLQEVLGGSMDRLARECVGVWPDPEQLDQRLAEAIGRLPHCHLLYALDTSGIQLSSNVSPTGADPGKRGQNVSGRPYHSTNLPYRGIMISSAYISEVSGKRCITAVQAVSKEGELLGFLGADFNLDELPDIPAPATEVEATQYRGDPAIRSTVFMQSRMRSAMDEHIDQVLAVMENLFREHGVFHTILHFSSSRVVLWLLDDPYNYRLHSVEELLDPELWLVYGSRPYPNNAAKVSLEQLHLVFEYFKALRAADENIYLRSSSINIMNGVVGLTFSCDGSHYMQAEEFLNKELSFWI